MNRVWSDFVDDAQARGVWTMSMTNGRILQINEQLKALQAEAYAIRRDCEHEWKETEHDDGAYRHTVVVRSCIKCGAVVSAWNKKRTWIPE